MIHKGHDETDDGKVKYVAPIGVVGVLRQLVVCNHDACCDDVGEDGAAENDQDVLRDKSPWGMARSEEGRLFGEHGQQMHLEQVSQCSKEWYLLTWSCIALGPGRPPTAESKGVESIAEPSGDEGKRGRRNQGICFDRMST